MGPQGDDPLRMIYLDQELCKEVIATQNRDANGAERCGKQNFPFGNRCPKRLGSAVMDR